MSWARLRLVSSLDSPKDREGHPLVDTPLIDGALGSADAFTVVVSEN